MSETTIHPKARIPRRKRRGYSIVEIGLVLIVVAVLIAAIIVAFYQVQQSTRQGQATNLVNELYSSVQDLHRSATSYGPDGTNLVPILEGAEMLPPIGRRDPDASPDSGDEVVFSPFGELVTVVAGGAVGVPGQSFTITLTNYTRANCIAFMSNYVDRTLEQSGLLGASSGGAAFAFPVTVASINGTCQAGDLAIEYR
jgi:type II secretory pathway pseudopilin PulG